MQTSLPCFLQYACRICVPSPAFICGPHSRPVSIWESAFLFFRRTYRRRIVTDVVAVGMYVAHFDAAYLTKKSIYPIMAVIGLVNRARLNKERNAANE